MSLFSNKLTQGIVKVVLSPLYLSKVLLSRFDSEASIEKAHAEIEQFGKRHEVPGRDYPIIGDKIPAHLLDEMGPWEVSSDGVPLTAKFHDNEVYTGYISPAIPLYMLAGVMLIALNIILSALNLQYFSLGLLAIYSFFFIRMMGFGTFFLFALSAFPFTFLSHANSIPMIGGLVSNMGSNLNKIAFVVSLLPALFIYGFTRRYNKNYYATLANNSLKYVSNSKAQISEARKLQAVNAALDKSNIFYFGEALGATARKGDALGPDKGQAFAWSHIDMRTNILFQGKTQTGKTSAGLKPIGMFISANQIEGEAPDSMIVVCGKRTLPKDFVQAGIVKNEHRIHPDFINFNWIHQMASRPAVVAHEIYKAVSGKNAKSDHWALSGKMAFEVAITMHRALIELNISDISQNAYFKTVRDVQFSMSETTNANESAELAKLVAGKTEEEAKAITANFAQDKKTGLIDKLMNHPDFIKEESMLSRAINNYELIFAKTPEERSGVFSTLAAWIDMFTSGETLNKWNFVKESDLILKELARDGGRYTVELSEDEFGPAGPVLTTLIFKFMNIYFLEDRPIDHNPEYPYFHIFMDEAHLVADDNLPGFMSLLLSKRVSFKVAFQMDESIIERFSESYLKTLKENCHIKVIFPTSEKTLENFSNGAGFINPKDKKMETFTKDILATMQNKTSSEWLNRNSENRSQLKSMFRNTHKKYVRGFIPKVENFSKDAKTGNTHDQLLTNYPNTVSVVNSERQEPIFGKADFTKHFSEPFVCVVEAKVAGVIRRDFVKVRPMNNQGQRVDVSATEKIMKLLKEKTEQI